MHAIWGKHSLFEESLHAPLLIRMPDMPAPGVSTAGLAETVDVFPTLAELVSLPVPEGLSGRSLAEQLRDPEASGRPAVSYFRGNVTLRTESHRLIVHASGEAELYCHATPEGETLNLAPNNPRIVLEMAQVLHERAPEKLDEALLAKVTARYGR